MNASAPPGPSGDDEVLNFLERLERFLLRVIEGIGVFFVHRIPKWTYELIRGLVDNLWEYVERFVRIGVRVGRVTVLTAVLVAIVVGPGAFLVSIDATWLLALWIVLILGAVLFAVQHYVRKEHRRRKAQTASPRLVCSSCKTAHRGEVAPTLCAHCGQVWSRMEV